MVLERNSTKLWWEERLFYEEFYLIFLPQPEGLGPPHHGVQDHGTSTALSLQPLAI